jgi:DNA-binding transcriptional LysR family regulator
MIDAELYRIFYIVAECGTVSGAAQALYVSQPAVTKSVQKLEDLTGCRLFHRSSKGVRLTTEGRILFDYVKNGFGHLENGERVLKKIRDRQQGLVRVGISNTLCKYLFIPHLETFHKKYPGIRIAVVNRTSPETLKLLEQGHIDFGIISIPMDRSRFHFRELMTIQDIFVAGRRYPELKRPHTLSELTAYPLMTMEKDNVTRAYIDAHLAANSVALQPEIEVSSLEFLVEFARIGLGIAAVIGNFVQEELENELLHEIPVTPAVPPRKVGLVTPGNLPLSIAAETFIDVIRGRL